MLKEGEKLAIMTITCKILLVLVNFCVLPLSVWGDDLPEATGFTLEKNAALLTDPLFQWNNRQDFDFSTQGLMAVDENLVIPGPGGIPAWDSMSYEAFLNNETAANTVNPSLWRHALLNTKHGLFQVTDGIYQVRGQSAANLTVVEGQTGYIVIDPAATTEVASYNMNMVYAHVGRKPVLAMIYSHSHIDHFAGVKGIINATEVAQGSCEVIAPDGFVEAAVSENLLCGGAMGRRSMYMYGTYLPIHAKGQVDGGEPKKIEYGTQTLILPTRIITMATQSITIDGVEMVFQLAPGEAPSNMQVYFPQSHTMYIADNAVHSVQNVYTIRGARTRNCLDWATSLNTALTTDAEILCGGHHWPYFGRAIVRDYLTKQRDAVKYLHDQTLRMLNQGYIGEQIADLIQLPPSLASCWHLRNYYGNIKHDVKGIYSFYMGWYDANPAHLDPPEPRENAQKMVVMMGGVNEVVRKAQEAYNSGDYRFTAYVLDFALWTDPDHAEARILSASAMTQLGYQSEAATWRNAYLAGAQELRQGLPQIPPGTSQGVDMLLATPDDQMFEFLAIRLNGPRAFGKSMTFNWRFAESPSNNVVTLSNAVLNALPGYAEIADATIVITRAATVALLEHLATVDQAIATGGLQISDNLDLFKGFMSLLETASPPFPIVNHPLPPPSATPTPMVIGTPTASAFDYDHSGQIHGVDLFGVGQEWQNPQNTDTLLQYIQETR